MGMTMARWIAPLMKRKASGHLCEANQHQSSGGGGGKGPYFRGFCLEADASGNVGGLRRLCSGREGLMSRDMQIGCWPMYRSIFSVLVLRRAGRPGRCWPWRESGSRGVVDEGRNVGGGGGGGGGGDMLLELEAVWSAEDTISGSGSSS